MKILAAVIVILGVTFGSFGQNDPLLIWQNALGGSNFDHFGEATITSDGQILLVGSTRSLDGDVSNVNNTAWSDIWVVKLDADSNLIWETTFGGTYHDAARSVCEASDGGFVIGGQTKSNDGDVSGNHGDFDAWVVKIDAQGNLIWQNALGGSAEDRISSIIETSDGNIVVGANVASFDGDVTSNHGGFDCWIVKLDPTGNIIWKQCYGGSTNDYVEWIQETADNGLIVAGTTYSNDGDVSYNNGASDCWVFKLDELGNLIWDRPLGGSQIDYGKAVSEMYNGDFIVVGESNSTDLDVSNNIGDYDIWVVRLDALGNIVWDKNFGGSDHDSARTIFVEDNNDILIGGSTESDDGDVTGFNGYWDLWLLKIDLFGNLLWQKALGGSDSDGLLSVVSSPDIGIIVAGYVDSSDGDVTGHHGDSDAWVVKISEDYARINGKVFVDLNSNNVQEPQEQSLAQQKILNINTGHPSFTDINGNYSVIILDTGQTNISVDNLSYYSPQPATHSAAFLNLTQQVDSLNDFAEQPIGIFNDLQISITPVGPFRPGFSAQYVIDYSNIGTTVLSPEITCSLDSWLTYDYSTTTPTNIFSDSIYWQLPSLVPFQSGQITIYTTVDQSAPLGDPLTSSVRVDPILNDALLANNWSNWVSIIQGSFDPNDILVDRPRLDPSELAPAPPDLNYIIRFQNTGTDTAFTVLITNDVPNNAEPSTFVFSTSSHPVLIEYLPDANRFQFQFDNIQLPDSNINEQESHGFIGYKIKPFSSLVLGDSILNSARIYFDFNEPIFTNTAMTVIENSIGIEDIANSGFSVSPNPTGGFVNVQFTSETIGILTLTDAIGQEVLSRSFQGRNQILDLSKLPSGVYILNIRSKERKYSQKIVVE